MALIECPECKKQISDKTISCINCGFPIQTTQQPKLDAIVQDNSNIRKFTGYFKDIDGKIYNHNFFGINQETAISDFLKKNQKLSVANKQEIKDFFSVEKFSTNLSVADREEIKEILSAGKFSCPSCKSRFTNCERKIGCVVMIMIFISLGIGLIMIPFLPHHCECQVCGHKWKS